MTIDQLVSRALKLNNKDKALLAETLWESLERSNLSTLDMSDDDAINLAEQRDQELDVGIVQPISHEELMKRLRN